MNTSGYGNDGWMVVGTMAIGVVITIVVFGGPAETLDAANTFLREIGQLAGEFVRGLLR